MSAYSLPEVKPTFTHLQTHNFDDIAAQTWGWNVQYNQLSRGLFLGDFKLLELPGVQLHYLSYDRAMHIQGQAPPGTIAFAVDFGSRGRIKYCGQEATSPGNLFLTHPAHKALSFVGAESQKLAVLVFSGEEFNNSGYIFHHQEVRHLLRENQALRAMPSRLVRLKRLIKDIFEVTAASPEVILELPQVEEMIIRELTEGVLSLICTEDRLIREKTSPGFRREAVTRALDYIEGNLGEPHSLEEICQAAGASCRTLFYGFQDIMGLSPKAYLKARRLNAIRRDLLQEKAAPGAVFDVASRWGFWHMGQFGRDYKTMFGELPSDTLKRTKS